MLGYSSLVLSIFHKFEDSTGFTFLTKLPKLKKVFFEYPERKINIIGIESCAAIEDFSFIGQAKKPVELTRLHRLTKVYIEHGENIRSIFNCTQLQRLTIVDYKSKNLSELKYLKNLQTLELVNAIHLESLDGLSELTALKQIDIENARKLNDISEYSAFPGLIKLFVEGHKIYREQDLTEAELDTVVQKFGRNRVDTYFAPYTDSNSNY